MKVNSRTVQVKSDEHCPLFVMAAVKSDEHDPLFVVAGVRSVEHSPLLVTSRYQIRRIIGCFTKIRGSDVTLELRLDKHTPVSITLCLGIDKHDPVSVTFPLAGNEHAPLITILNSSPCRATKKMKKMYRTACQEINYRLYVFTNKVRPACIGVEGHLTDRTAPLDSSVSLRTRSQIQNKGGD